MTDPAHDVARQLKRYFLTGLVAVLPLLLTAAVLKWIAGIVNGYIGPRTMLGGALQSIGYRFSPSSNLWLAYVIGLGLAVGLIFVLGVLLESGFRRTMEQIAQRTIHQLPLVRAIYRTTDKFIDLMPNAESDQLKGMQVVYCRFGSSNAAAGTLGLMPTPEVFRIDGRDHRIVVIPTAPIPVGGAMLFVPVESVFSTTMSIEAFASSYVSMGVMTTHFGLSETLSAEETKKAEPAQAIDGKSPC